MSAQRLTRYEFSPVEQDPEGRVFLDVPYPTPKAILRKGAIPHVVKEGDTLWTIAWTHYKSILNREQDIRPTAYFFVIGWANDIVDPLEALTVGATIYVPAIEVVFGKSLVPAGRRLPST